MNRMRTLLHLAYADVLERTRRYSFVAMMAATLYLVYAIARGDLILTLGSWTGVMNAAWVGGMVATTAIILLTLFGFYLVKNTIERDTRTGVGQIIAATPVTGIEYLLGKWLSNWLVLTLLLGILAISAVIIVMFAAGPVSVELAGLLFPFILLGIPALAFVGALAVMFEVLPVLRSGAGNAIYFFLWSALFIAAFLTGSIWLDWTGLVIVSQSMGAAVRSVDPSYAMGFSLTTAGNTGGQLRHVLWQGIAWTPAFVMSRLLWIGISALCVTLSAGVFRRFDPSRERVKKGGEHHAGETSGAPQTADAKVAHDDVRYHLSLTAASVPPRYRLGRHLWMDLVTTMKGWPWWWYAGVCVCIVGGLVSPVADARQAWLPCAWLWPLVLWSGIGTRDVTHQTEGLLFASPGPVLRQVAVMLVAGVVVSVVTGSGVLMNLLVHADWPGVSGWLAGAVFIPSLAIAVGLWTRTAKVFEIVYLLVWYLGPLHPRDLPALDYLGATNASIAAGMPATFGLIAVGLWGLAFAARWFRLGR
jgi:hypothetical protein